MKTLLKLTVCLTMACVASSCLKTRAQLKEDGSDDQEGAKPVAANVQPVEPKGQYVIDEIKGEITRLNGRIEDLERAKAQAATANTAAATEAEKKLEARVIELETAQAQMLEAIKKIQNIPPPDSVETFEKGKAQLTSGELEPAIESFTTYLKAPNAKFGEEATFLRGEAFFQTKQYKKAIVDYSKFPEKYTKSRRMAAALLKIGQSFEALGMKDDAKGFFQELVEKFPKSPEAKKARSKVK